MKLIIVRSEDYDCHTVGVAHPVEFESKELLIEEFNKKKNQEEIELNKLYPEERDAWRKRHTSIVLCNLLINLDFLNINHSPEFYTFDEWFEKYKDFNSMTNEEIEERDAQIKSERDK